MYPGGITSFDHCLATPACEGKGPLMNTIFYIVLVIVAIYAIVRGGGAVGG